jgi:hypothetical protein
MNRLDLTQSIKHFVAAVGAIALVAALAAGAQTAPPAKKPVPVKKTATPPAAKPTTTKTPVATTTTAAPVAKTATTTTTAPPQTQSTSTVVTPASSQTVLTPSNSVSNGMMSTPVSNVMTSTPVSSVMSSAPVSGVMSSAPVSGVMSSAPVSNVLSSTPLSTVTPTSAVNSMTQANGTGANMSAPAGSRAPVSGQGVGTFVSGPWTLIAYDCLRSGTRLFCDFDTTNQNNTGANSEIWHPVSLVDDGGKITTRHNAFFVGDDGSQFTTAYLTAQKPARFIIEFDDVDQRYNSISLVLGRDQIQGVPITQMDPSQPVGTIPARASTTGALQHH